MPQHIALITGSRAEYGLLSSTLDAARERDDLRVSLIVAGLHLVTDSLKDIAGPIAAKVPMQEAGRTGRLADADALARGVRGFAAALGDLRPDRILVLGDRIEPFAAATAATLLGIPVAHIHGGDRARGVADDRLRDAMTAMADLHFPATETSAARLRQLGVADAAIGAIGSPAVDGLDDARFQRAPHAADLLVLHHASGLPPAEEQRQVFAIAEAVQRVAGEHGWRVGVADANHDAGADAVADAMARADWGGRVERVRHLSRPLFLAQLRRARVLVGNSSAGLIEAAIMGVPNVCVGTRQAGRETPPNTRRVPSADADALAVAIAEAATLDRDSLGHPYGDPGVGVRIAAALAGESAVAR